MNKIKTKGTPNKFDIYIGAQLRVARESQKMTQDKLAAAVGLTFQQIQKYERGTNRISSGRLYELAKALNVSIHFFYQGIEEAEQEQTPTRDDSLRALNKAEMELIQLYRDTNDNGKFAIQSVANIAA